MRYTVTIHQRRMMIFNPVVFTITLGAWDRDAAKAEAASTYERRRADRIHIGKCLTDPPIKKCTMRARVSK